MITHWEQPHHKFESQYGHVTFRDWCYLELDRINGHGDSVRIITRNDGALALYR